MNQPNPDLLRAITLKVAFKPEPLRRAQAAILYVGLEGCEFTADCLPGEIVAGDTTISGCAVGALATMRLIERTGRCKSPAKSRNGAWVNTWRVEPSKRSTVLTWLERNQFPAPDLKPIEAELQFNGNPASN